MNILDQEKALALLIRAAIRLQDYSDELGGNHNEPLTQEIEKFVKGVKVA